MQEGDVVLVAGALDDRVRENSVSATREGTIVWMNKDDVVVLLPNGDLWRGSKREVFIQAQEETKDESNS